MVRDRVVGIGLALWLGSTYLHCNYPSYLQFIITIKTAANTVGLELGLGLGLGLGFRVRVRNN